MMTNGRSCGPLSVRSSGSASPVARARGRRRARGIRRCRRTHVAEVVAARLLDELPDGSSALVLAIEHLWAVPLRDAVRDAGGIVIAHRSLTAEDLIALGMALGEEAEIEAQLEAEAAEAGTGE